MDTLMQAHRQWASRPQDQRFTSLIELRNFMDAQRDLSRSTVVSSRSLRALPAGNDYRGLMIEGPSGAVAEPTHWSFGQLAQLAGAPAGYLRDLPSPVAADCINYGLQIDRDVEEVGVLLTQRATGAPELRAATGPRYGRVWNGGNNSVLHALVEKFGDGITGQWRAPGEFGQDVTITKDNTTFYGSDRDMFVFLADEHNRIEVPNRRDGKTGGMARGFFVWNSEVGASSLGAAFFLFDYVCCNRIVWGAQDFNEIRIRHDAGAPDRWLEEIAPVFSEYANASAKPVMKAIEDARSKRLDDKLDSFLTERFGKKMGIDLKAVHQLEENRPIETLWDVTTAVTAFARNLPNQDRRVELEREAGKILHLAA